MSEKVIISSETALFDLRLGELLKYRDLIWIFFKRNYSTRYKQTILGPTWLVISPLLTIFCYTIVFGHLAGLSTDGIPRPLFYLAGNIFWEFFSDCFNSNANTFTGNAGIFGKVYFPRMVVPLSNAITSFFDFVIRFILLFVFIAFYHLRGNVFFMTYRILLLPILLLQIALLGIGVGIIVSSVTTKYRDLQILVGVGMRIWMYGTPVVYSTTIVPEHFKELFMLNPVTPAMLIFKNALFSTDLPDLRYFILSCSLTIFLFFVGVIIFNKVERTFMDTV